MPDPTDAPAPSPWHAEEEETLADCRVFEVERHRMRREHEPRTAADFYVLRSPDWINIVALTDSDDLVLIEQWRHAVREITLEIPGGMVDPGESPFAAAARELREETGFRAREWFHYGHVQPNPAIHANRCHTFLALGATREGEPEFDGTEECRLVLRPYAEAAELVASGTIRHALVISALHFESLRRSGTLEPTPAGPDPLGGETPDL